jgi:Uma2 family endonuclease
MSEKIETPPGPMTVEQFYAWVDQQPKGRYELNRGEVFAMAPELIGHARAKFAATLALRSAIKAAGLPCEAFVDGVGIRVGEDTLYIPDASVNCGDAAPGAARDLPEPVIVVEVTSPSTARVDTTDKLEDYFRIPSIQHYLQVNLKRRAVFHHRRLAEGGVLSTLLRAGPLTLDPPGLTIQVEEFFEALA